MATIKKTLFPYKWFDKAVVEETAEQDQLFNQSPINIFLDITSSTFEFKMTKLFGDQSVDLVWHKINLVDLQNKPGFVDQTAWVVDMHSPTYNQTEMYEVKESDLVDLFATTLISKPQVILKEEAHRKCPYLFFVKNVDSQNGFLDFDFRITLDPDTEYTFSGPSANLISEETVTLKDMVSPITLTSTSTQVEADGSVIVNVSTDNDVREVFLEQIYGTTNKSRVKITNGQGSFKLSADGFTAGESIRVKAGFKKFTGIVDFSVPVV